MPGPSGSLDAAVGGIMPPASSKKWIMSASPQPVRASRKLFLARATASRRKALPPRSLASLVLAIRCPSISTRSTASWL